ncbi:MAG: peptidase U32 family protein [Saprospiraceae bacterium]
MKRKIEILAPAKNLYQGMAAVNAGADAVYMGAHQFGARSNATNSVEDIAQMVRYAHLFKAKVLVTINTILYDNELSACRKLIHELYDVGVDAIIIQDMAILEMDLPPIALHASTQANNRDAAHVKFLADAGIKRVVLARELNLDQIREIHQATDVELEFFVTGALCVSFSGNCYMSVANGERSANRGSCAQNCRLPYQLIDGKGETLIHNSHLLSIKDLDLSNEVPNLVAAGVSSFKIEGRLKDIVYVKTIPPTCANAWTLSWRPIATAMKRPLRGALSINSTPNWGAASTEAIRITSSTTAEKKLVHGKALNPRGSILVSCWK